MFIVRIVPHLDHNVNVLMDANLSAIMLANALTTLA